MSKRQMTRATRLSLEDCEKYYHLPVEKACEKLGVSRPTIARVLRANGIPRWPYRKVHAEQRKTSTSSAAATAIVTANLLQQQQYPPPKRLQQVAAARRAALAEKESQSTASPVRVPAPAPVVVPASSYVRTPLPVPPPPVPFSMSSAVRVPPPPPPPTPPSLPPSPPAPANANPQPYARARPRVPPPSPTSSTENPPVVAHAQPQAQPEQKTLKQRRALLIAPGPPPPPPVLPPTPPPRAPVPPELPDEIPPTLSPTVSDYVPDAFADDVPEPVPPLPAERDVTASSTAKDETNPDALHIPAFAPGSSWSRMPKLSANGTSNSLPDAVPKRARPTFTVPESKVRLTEVLRRAEGFGKVDLVVHSTGRGQLQINGRVGAELVLRTDHGESTLAVVDEDLSLAARVPLTRLKFVHFDLPRRALRILDQRHSLVVAAYLPQHSQTALDTLKDAANQLGHSPIPILPRCEFLT